MDNLPQTAEGLKLYISYAKREIEYCNSKILRLQKEISLCCDSLDNMKKNAK